MRGFLKWPKLGSFKKSIHIACFPPEVDRVTYAAMAGKRWGAIYVQFLKWCWVHLQVVHTNFLGPVAAYFMGAG